MKSYRKKLHKSYAINRRNRKRFFLKKIKKAASCRQRIFFAQENAN